MHISVLAGLILCNLVWALNPVATKILLEESGAPTVAWLRYSSAALTLIGVALLGRVFARQSKSGDLNRSTAMGFWIPGTLKSRLILLALGVVTFCITPLLQIIGLSTSQAVDNALIIAIEPLMTTLMAWLILGEALTRKDLAAFVVALFGFSLLSGLTPARIFGGLDSHLLGNLLILLSLVGEATFSPLSRILMRESSASSVFRTALFIGVLALTLLVFTVFQAPALWTEGWDLRRLGALLWLGPFGTAATYYFWIWALSRATIAQMVLTLFVQPLAGALFGAWILGERIALIQGVGGLLILAAVLVPTLTALKRD
jgi:drug/metabolite transporter (DMT)-like permease